MDNYDDARKVLANAYDTAHKITGGREEYHPGGSVWVWDGHDPIEGGSWHIFGTRWPVDPNAATCLEPRKVDAARHEAEVLFNVFPATEARLGDMGCTHVELLHKTIVSAEDILLWSCSIFNACTPLPRPWHAGYSDHTGPGVRDWPWHVFSSAQLLRSKFCSVQANDEGRIAVLPIDEGASVIYWAEPGTRYDEDVRKAAEKGMDKVLGPRHPVSLAAYHGRWIGNIGLEDPITSKESRV